MIHAKEVAVSEALAAREYLAGWQRARAELDNLRKQGQQREADAARRQLRAIVEPLLLLSDNFRAIAGHVPAKLKNDPWAQGVLHVVRQLDDILSTYGLQPINQAKVPFDPARHEALADDGAPPGQAQVIEVLRPGYELDGFVIRPAQVKVK